MLPAAVPGSMSRRCGLGAEGSSLSGSIGDGETLTGVSEEPVAPWAAAPVDCDGVVVPLELDVPGVVVVSDGEDVVGFVVVCAEAGDVAISTAMATIYIRVSTGHVLKDAPSAV